MSTASFQPELKAALTTVRDINHTGVMAVMWLKCQWEIKKKDIITEADHIWELQGDVRLVGDSQIIDKRLQKNKKKKDVNA